MKSVEVVGRVGNEIVMSIWYETSLDHFCRQQEQFTDLERRGGSSRAITAILRQKKGLSKDRPSRESGDARTQRVQPVYVYISKYFAIYLVEDP